MYKLRRLPFSIKGLLGLRLKAEFKRYWGLPPQALSTVAHKGGSYEGTRPGMWSKNAI